MRFSRGGVSAFIAVLACGSSDAGVLIVSPIGPHTQIGSAVAAASDGDLILVKSGTYSGFTVQNKGLWIVADAGTAVNVSNTITLTGLSASKTIVLRGLSGNAPGINWVGQPALRVDSCAGEVRIENSTLAGTGYSIQGHGGRGAIVSNCESVAFLRCTLTGGSGGDIGIESGATFVGTGADGLAASNSNTVVYDSICSGGKGGSDFEDDEHGGHGGSGASIVAGTLFASGSAFVGATGGQGGWQSFSCGNGGNGGDGLDLVGGAVARTLDSSYVPGSGGNAGCSGSSDGWDGLGIDASGGTIVSFPEIACHLEGTTPVREGDAVVYSLAGGANEAVTVVSSLAAGHSYLPPNAGVLLLFAPQTLFTGTLDSSGSLVNPLPVPELGPGILELGFHVQGYFTDAGGNAVLSSATEIVLLDSSLPAPAPNDGCAGAVPLAVGLTPGSNVAAATSTATPTCGTLGNDVWYSYQAPVKGTLSVGFCAPGAGATFDTVLALFTGACGTSSTACSDDACGTGSALSSVLDAGQKVRIAVGGKAGATGTFTLHVDFIPAPANDTAATALAVGEGLISGSNVGDVVADPLAGVCGGTKDVWFSFVPSCTGAARAGFCAPGASATGFDPILSVFSDAFGAMTEVSCSDDRCGALSDVAFPCVAGQRYLLRIASKTGATGDFTLAIACQTTEIHQTELLGLANTTGASTLVRINTFPWKSTTVGSAAVANLRSLDVDPASGATRAANVPPFQGVKSTLYAVNSATGVATLVGTTGVDAIGGLAFDGTGALYGTATVSAASPLGSLVALNPATAATTVIGSFDPAGLIKDVRGLAADPAAGTLYGSTGPLYDGTPGDLFTIDKATGLATLAGALSEFGTTAPVPASLSGLAADDSSTLYGSLAAPATPGGSASIGRVLAINVSTLTYLAYGDAGSASIDGLAAPCPGNELYGKGCAGSGGFTPLLTLSGCTLQGSTVTLSLRNALGGSAALLVFGVAPASAPLGLNCTLNVAPLLPISIALPLPGSGAGQGAIELAALLPPVPQPVAVTLQALVADASVPKGVAASNGLAITVR